jgi:hypothetical protein
MTVWRARLSEANEWHSLIPWALWSALLLLPDNCLFRGHFSMLKFSFVCVLCVVQWGFIAHARDAGQRLIRLCVGCWDSTQHPNSHLCAYFINANTLALDPFFPAPTYANYACTLIFLPCSELTPLVHEGIFLLVDLGRIL